jgi:type 1 glutamine amidotransferase/nicotinamidase-related amidase
MIRRSLASWAVSVCLSAVCFAAQNRPLKVVMLSGSDEYKSDESLPPFQKYLEERYNVRCTVLKACGDADLPGLEALDNCDVALFFTRRLKITGDQLERVKKYCESGRPVVGVRTASHGFQNWLEFDKTVQGGNYTGHFGNGPSMKATIVPAAKSHPVLEGVSPTIKSIYSLYKTAPLAPDCEVVMTGSTPASSGTQPVAWTRVYRGARVFYTSMGGPQDFENAAFRRLMANALFWAANRKVESKEIASPPQRPKPTGELRLILRSRVETPKGSNVWIEQSDQKTFPIAETAILICDMWDRHWCSGAAKRCEPLAQKMNPVLKAARDKGVQIIHCPSETLDFYADWPQRRRMMLAPVAVPPTPLAISAPPLPIDDSDGGCDSGEKPWYPAWTRQNAVIEIGEFDGISDNGAEVFSFLRQQGIRNLLIMGVHTNMCVLNRSFAIRQMTRWGIRCVLVRDLTDTMYNPKSRPFVSHEEGTELVVQYIEKYWCPSTLSDELVAGLPK